MFDDWYDYLNPVEYLKAGKKALFDDPAKNVKGAYDKAIAGAQGNAKQLTDFYDQRKQQALGFYQPLQQMFSDAYGKRPGIAPPQAPQGGVPGSQPLGQMFGGKR